MGDSNDATLIPAAGKDGAQISGQQSTLNHVGQPCTHHKGQWQRDVQGVLHAIMPFDTYWDPEGFLSTQQRWVISFHSPTWKWLCLWSPKWCLHHKCLYTAGDLNTRWKCDHIIFSVFPGLKNLSVKELICVLLLPKILVTGRLRHIKISWAPNPCFHFLATLRTDILSKQMQGLKY